MKKSILIMMLVGILFSLYSCRDETEVNTDGNMEETETRQVEDAG